MNLKEIEKNKKLMEKKMKDGDVIVVGTVEEFSLMVAKKSKKNLNKK